MMESLLGLPMQAMQKMIGNRSGGYTDFSKPQPTFVPEEQGGGMPSQFSMDIRNAVQGGMNQTGIPQFAQGIRQGVDDQFAQLRQTLQAQLPQQAIDSSRSFFGNNPQQPMGQPMGQPMSQPFVQNSRRPFAQNFQQPMNNAMNPLMGRFFGR